MNPQDAPRWIAAIAERDGLDLAGLKSAARADVRAWRARAAAARQPSAPPAAAAKAPASRHPANPLVDELRRERPHLYARAAKEQAVPGMFGLSDVPPATASGNNPRDVRRLPPRVRHAAQAADQPEWARLMATYADRDVDDSELIYEPAASDPGWFDYVARVDAFAAGNVSS